MATRGIVRFTRREEGVTFSEYPGVDKVHVEIYNHYDSYPEVLGVYLAEFLEDFKVTNGLSGDTSKVANGMGCLAAQLIAEMKDGPGSVYLQKPSEDTGWAEYVYYIWVVENKDIWISIFTTYDDKCIFVGRPEKLIEKYDEERN
jgi:hypothetical protein